MDGKKIALVLLICFVFISFGCSMGPGGEEGNVNYRKGSQGLEMRFVINNPPPVIYEHDYLPIQIELFNKGTAEITRGMLYLTGYDTNIINNNPWSGVPSGNLPPYGVGIPFSSSAGILEPKTQFNNQGGYDLIDLQSGEIDLPPGTSTYEIPLVAYACYDYYTLASDTICIDPQPHRTTVDKPCITQNVNMGGTQGAPVAVTNIDVTNMRDQVKLVFTIQNVGNGQVVDLSQMDKCPTSFSPADIDTVYLDYATLGPNFPLTCQPGNKVKLNNGYGRVICTVGISGETAYKTPVQIKVSYGYRTFIRQNVQVRGYE